MKRTNKQCNSYYIRFFILKNNIILVNSHEIIPLHQIIPKYPNISLSNLAGIFLHSSPINIFVSDNSHLFYAKNTSWEISNYNSQIRCLLCVCLLRSITNVWQVINKNKNRKIVVSMNIWYSMIPYWTEETLNLRRVSTTWNIGIQYFIWRLKWESA